MNEEKKYPIKVVSQRTGLTAHVIRAWEKRYSVLKPARTDSNRRLYSEEDIERLKLLSKAKDEGYSIGSIAHLGMAELKEMISSTSHLKPPSEELGLELESVNGSDTEKYILDCLSAIQKLDAGEFERELLQASVHLSQPVLLERVIIPLLDTVGELWQEGRLRIIHEHFATAVLKPFLFNLKRGHHTPESAPSIIVTTPRGQHHELGALILSVVAAAQGWQVTYLGTDLPAEEIAAATIEKEAKVLSLSMVYPQNDPTVSEELYKLGQILPENVRILVGGRAAKSYSDVLGNIKAELITDLPSLRKRLDKLSETV